MTAGTCNVMHVRMVSPAHELKDTFVCPMLCERGTDCGTVSVSVSVTNQCSIKTDEQI